ncbi:uncharacterized protein LACBIDRAFT_316583 [Laccaria bicolor S238N-H82]|uniref:Predicted protein n=1 Tax=Laccaria bicolor (strain S238N-H82 / ATCC MYA-4686) TaxID=486041 RepID=B0E173_LACBS|nr:uncharacterized protein LACBIDRAFT_316583 [Laccaria bicolor S238N-H82]EDQ99377.1 predicted protein [Laccaria bicolor S238N-H82]|eukprot:XP_001889928.1 predicted protein [Laccaria bicolor S238N-H82]
MAGSKGKEAFRRPLRQLKTPPGKDSAPQSLFPLSPAHQPWLRHRSLTQFQSLADAGLGEVIDVASLSCAGPLSQTTSTQHSDLHT